MSELSRQEAEAPEQEPAEAKTGQQSRREAGAPQKLDSPPTRAGTLDGGSSGGLLPKLPVRAGNSGRRCRRTAQRSDEEESMFRVCPPLDRGRVAGAPCSMVHEGAVGFPIDSAPLVPICPLGRNEPGQGGWAVGVGCGG